MPDELAAVPSERPIIAFFDVDNTLLRGASAFHVGVGAFRKHMISARDIATFGWHQLRFLRVGENVNHLAVVKDRGLALGKGLKVSELVALANDIYDRAISRRLWPESVELAREHLRKGHEVWLISATPQIVAQVISDRLGLSGALGTVAEESDGRFTGRIVGDVMHGPAKAHAAEALALAKGADLEECWAYSDSSNDIPLLSLVGNRVVVNPDRTLAVHASAEHWATLILKPASIREAQRWVRREARAVKRKVR
jgi:HAD superfamily hydrolase (TIGR01490 family)